MALTDKLSAIGDAIRAKTGGTELLTLDQMPTEIEAIKGKAEIEITGDCKTRFFQNAWVEMLNNPDLTFNAHDIIASGNMFGGSTLLEEIPIELNGEGCTSGMFYNCTAMKIPCSFGSWQVLRGTSEMFRDCHNLAYLPEGMENWDWSRIEENGNGNDKNSSAIGDNGRFRGCYSLRSIPTSVLANGSSSVGMSYSLYNRGFYECYSLDEIVGLKVINSKAISSNAFDNTFKNCARVKNLTFALNNGAPYVARWQKQIIDLSGYVGYAWSSYEAGFITNYNSGITTDKLVYDDATYQALKNDPDWYSIGYDTDFAYSRYNHDSAVATINSLPDTSAYLAEVDGTANMIKFEGTAGSATDGGAINTLTKEEIAVAAAKGWTVTLS